MRVVFDFTKVGENVYRIKTVINQKLTGRNKSYLVIVCGQTAEEDERMCEEKSVSDLSV